MVKKNKWDKINKARERKRLEREAVPMRAILSDPRRELIVIDHDFGTVKHHFRCYETSHINCYRVTVDGKPWKEKIGFSKILEGIRLSMPCVQSPYS